MIRTLYRHRSGTVVNDLPKEQLARAVKEAQARLWIDLFDPTLEEQRFVFEDLYKFHPLAIEDAIKDLHMPKVDDYGSYLYLVFHTITPGNERMDLHTEELDIFLGNNYLITMHEEPRQSIDALWQVEHHAQKGLAVGTAFLLYELIDYQIDDYTPLLEEFEERLEQLGDEIFRKLPDKNDQLLNDILTAKSSALRLNRVLRPQRELINRLAWNEFAVIPAEARIYFHDLYDHLSRLTDIALAMLELSSGTMETYVALTNNRLNEVMKVLTMISTIFIPLSFVAGIYGMNFDFMPELNQWWGYPLALAVMLVIAIGMVVFFRRKRWL